MKIIKEAVKKVLMEDPRAEIKQAIREIVREELEEEIRAGLAEGLTLIQERWATEEDKKLVDKLVKEGVAVSSPWVTAGDDTEGMIRRVRSSTRFLTN